MDRKMLVWLAGGAVAAAGVIAIVASPSETETPYDTAFNASKRFGVEADTHLRELDAMLTSDAPTGKGSPACAKARVTLRQQRVAFKAIQSLTGRTTDAVTSGQDVAELRALREANLVRASETRTRVCDGETGDPA